MSNFRLSFSGDVRKPTVKDIGGKKAVEFKLMKKNYAKQGDEATFTWVRVTLFDAKDWQIAQCQEGKFVSGSGEFSMRSYVDANGVKKDSVEVRCSSFDFDAPREQSDSVPYKGVDFPAKTPKRVPDVSSIGAGGNDEPPFKSDLGADAWG